MRDWLNGILQFIGATSLTDLEYASMNVLNISVNTYNQAAYDELSKVLTSREGISTLQDNLTALFKIKGLEVTPAKTGKSNVLMGFVLE